MSSSPAPSSAPLSPRRELWLLLTLAGIQFTHILDFMIMMPLGSHLMRVFAIGPDNAIFKWNGSAWVKRDGLINDISVSAKGVPFGIDANKGMWMGRQ